MKRRYLAWLFLVMGLCLLCVAGVALFYQAQCPNPNGIETVIPADAEIEITLERTICFGTCPSYRLHIVENGRIYYNGRAHTQKPGQYEGQMSQAVFQRLVRAFETYNFYALAAEYRRASNPLCSEQALDRWVK